MFNRILRVLLIGSIASTGLVAGGFTDKQAFAATCDNTSGEFNAIIFVKVVDDENNFVKYADNFRFRVSSYAQQGASSEDYALYNTWKQNTIIRWHEGVVTSYGPGPVDLQSKRGVNGQPETNRGNLCDHPGQASPNHPARSNVMAYAFRSGDGTAHGVNDFPALGQNSKYVGGNPGSAAYNNGSYSLSCLHSSATSYRFTALDVIGEGPGSFLETVKTAEPNITAQLNGKSRVITFTYKLDDKDDPNPQPENYAVTVTPNASAGADVEVGESMTFNQSATVTGFPRPWQWGYTEHATQRAVNTGIVATRQNYDPKQGEEAANTEADKKIQCANSNWNDTPSSCNDLGIFTCSNGATNDTCQGTTGAGAAILYKWRCEKKAANGGGYNDFERSSNTRAGIARPDNCREADQYYDIQCSDGVYRNPSNCSDRGKFLCAGGAGKDECTNYRWQCTWAGFTKEVEHSSSTVSGMDGCKIFKFYCKDTNGNYLSSGPNELYKHFNGKDQEQDCNNYWVCPSPSNVTGYGSDDKSADCRIFRCYVQADVSYGTWHETGTGNDADARCDFRCSGGTGLHAELAVDTADGKWSGPDLRCFQRPLFGLTCTWDSGAFTYQNVTADGIYCAGPTSSATKTASAVGVICATTTPTNGAWSSPPPGQGRGKDYAAVRANWAIQIIPPTATACGRAVAKPIAKIYGGDVAVGASFTTDSCTSSNPGSSIVGWPGRDTNYLGSSTEYGAYAPNVIHGFATSMKQSGSTKPRGLAFANTIGTGDTFGGGFGAMPCIMNHAAMKPTTGIGSKGSLSGNQPSGSYELSGGNAINDSPEIRKTKQYIVYVNGDLSINTNITYERGGWLTVEDIPALKLVVSGNIYIAPGVTELNGVFVAQPDSSGNGGNIYTCAGVSNMDSYGPCLKNLTVNGSFIAKRVVLGRTIGTQRAGTTAEEFRYLPELWLTKWPQADPTQSIQYDSITNLAPIL